LHASFTPEGTLKSAGGEFVLAGLVAGFELGRALFLEANLLRGYHRKQQGQHSNEVHDFLHIDFSIYSPG
jgi:hypothetical protein